MSTQSNLHRPVTAIASPICDIGVVTFHDDQRNQVAIFMPLAQAEAVAAAFMAHVPAEVTE